MDIHLERKFIGTKTILQNTKQIQAILVRLRMVNFVAQYDFINTL